MYVPCHNLHATKIERPAGVLPQDLQAIHVSPNGRRVWLAACPASKPTLGASGATMVFRRRGIAATSIFGSSWELVWSQRTPCRVALGDCAVVRWTEDALQFEAAGSDLDDAAPQLRWAPLAPPPAPPLTVAISCVCDGVLVYP